MNDVLNEARLRLLRGRPAAGVLAELWSSSDASQRLLTRIADHPDLPPELFARIAEERPDLAIFSRHAATLPPEPRTKLAVMAAKSNMADYRARVPAICAGGLTTSLDRHLSSSIPAPALALLLPHLILAEKDWRRAIRWKGFSPDATLTNPTIPAFVRRLVSAVTI